MHAGLGDDLVDPSLEGLCRPLGVTCGLPLGLQAGLELSDLVDATQQVFFQAEGDERFPGGGWSPGPCRLRTGGVF
jgi:hypothetical protein